MASSGADPNRLSQIYASVSRGRKWTKASEDTACLPSCRRSRKGSDLTGFTPRVEGRHAGCGADDAGAHELDLVEDGKQHELACGE
eukprot:3795635-Prymnesium_polylepis.1